jgi:hypothetical protein
MSILTGVLPSLQALSEGEMPDTVTIHRPGAATANAGGAMVPAGSSDISTVGRISTLSEQDRETLVSGQVRTEGWQRLTIPRAVEVRGTDTVTVASARNGTTTDYTVEQVVPSGSFAVHHSALLRPT